MGNITTCKLHKPPGLAMPLACEADAGRLKMFYREAAKVAKERRGR